ncbi:MAG: methyltransferase, partial [Acidimicrobiales bacterium]
ELRAAGLGPPVLAAQVRRLRRLVSRLRPRGPHSAWSRYQDNSPYSLDDLAAKDAFVRSVAAQRRRRQVLDLGANDGRFAVFALDHADQVVAVDADDVSVDRLYRSRRDGTDQRLIPVRADLTDLSGGRGWAGRQRRPLIERVDPDLTMMMAIVHHLAITEAVPFEAIVDLLAALGSEVVIEFAKPTDPMVTRLLRRKRGRDFPYDEALFESAVKQRFDVVDRQELPHLTRALYHLRPRR